MKTLAAKIGILILAWALPAGANEVHTAILVQTEAKVLHSQYLSFTGEDGYSHPLTKTNSIRLLRQGEELAAEKTILGWLDLPDKFPDLDRQELTYLPARTFLDLAANALAQRSGLENRVPDLPWVAMVGKTTLAANAQANEILIDGPADDRAFVLDLAKLFNLRSENILLRCALLDVALDEKAADDPNLIPLEPAVKVEGETLLDAAREFDEFVTGLVKSGCATVMSKPSVFAGNQQPATISFGDTNETTTIGMSAMINPEREITLEIDLETSGLSSVNSFRLPEGSLMMLPAGDVRTRPDGSKVQLVLALYPKIIDAAKVTAAGGEDNWLKREIKYMPAKNLLPIAAKAISEFSGEEIHEPDKNETVLSTLVGKTPLVANPNQGHLMVNGPREHLDLIDQLVTEIDVRPRQAKIKAIIAKVELGDDIQYGMDILRTVEGLPNHATSTGGGTILPNEEGKDLETIRKLLEDHPQIEIEAGSTLLALNNKASEIRRGPGFQLKILPLVNSSDEVTLEVEVVSKSVPPDNSGSYSSMNTTVRLPNGGIVILGGIVSEAGGKRSELLIFAQPMSHAEK